MRSNTTDPIKDIDDENQVDKSSFSEKKEAPISLVMNIHERLGLGIPTFSPQIPEEQVVGALNSQNWKIRVVAAQIVGSSWERGSTDLLMKALKDEHVGVRLAAIRSIGEIEGEIPVEPLVELLHDPEWSIRTATLNVLSKFSEQIPLAALLQAAHDEHDSVRAAAIQALGHFSEHASQAVLVEALHDSEWLVREAAVMAIDKLGLYDLLEPFLTKPIEDNIIVRQALRIALSHQQTKKSAQPLATISLQELASEHPKSATKDQTHHTQIFAENKQDNSNKPINRSGGRLDRSGQRLGHYVLIRLIGRGGSADVYLARNLHLRSLCAIKILRTPLIRKGRRQFLEEARLAATLEHDHIVRILDFDIQNGIPHIVMSYAPRGSLRSLHPRGTQLSFKKTLDYLEQIADALDYLHSHNLIHLDIKPENLLVGHNYEVLLGDFGITEAAYRISGSRPGTLNYMSPEHARGKPCAASDQYALAICVYEWLTGQPPFNGTRAEVRWQHLHNRPGSLRDLAPDIPSVMERVVLRALAKNPQQRYPSVGAFVAAFREATPPPLPPITPPSLVQIGLSKLRRWMTACHKRLLTRE